MRLTRVAIALALGLSTVSGLLAGLAVSPAAAAGPYAPRAPIIIMSDADFTAANGVVSGVGDGFHPYIIEGWDIDASAGSSAGITISNTNSFFIVKDCYVHGGMGYDLKYGIELYRNAHAYVQNCVVQANFIGIMAMDCPGVYILVNEATGSNVIGIHVNSSAGNAMGGSCTIIGNNASGNTLRGIDISFSDAYVSSSTVSGNGEVGILAKWSHVGVSANTVRMNPVGINLTECSDSYVSGNDVSTEGAPGAVQAIILRSSTGCDVQHNLIDTWGYGISILESDHISFLDNTITGLPSSNAGMFLRHVSNCTLRNTTVTGCLWGIWFSSASWTLVDNSVVQNNTNGIWLHSAWNEDGTYLGNYVDHVQITGNVVDHNSGKGIYLMSICRDSEISGNLISNNGGPGLEIDFSQRTLVANNTFWNNTGSGIVLTGITCKQTTIVNNQLIANAPYGVKLDSCDETLVYHNFFSNNTVQAFEDDSGFAIVNKWDNGYPSGGNYWSDYTGVDLYSGPGQNVPGSDGIGDTPYVIDTGHQDMYPFMQSDFTPPPQGNTTTATTYRVYEMFQEPWHEWWDYRYPVYGTDIILTDTPGNYTMLYNPDRLGSQGIIWAPYRMNITAINLTEVNVHQPEFMPVLDSTHSLAGAKATIDLYFEYLNWSWWNQTWVPRWQGDPSWFAGSMNAQTSDGWYLGVQYNVTMNREAAQEWLRLPVTVTDVAAWWAANASSYKAEWKTWLLNEGNNRLDIFNAYEFPLVMTGPYADLKELPNGDVRLELDHISWGYEVLMNRWLMETQISTHQPNLEDFTMSAKLGDRQTDLTLDTVCQYNLRAVKANQSSGTDAAWAFEPVRADYIAPSSPHPYSDYAPYATLTYRSWYAGDPWFGTESAYGGFDCTPGYFNLTESQTLAFELPKHDQVICYEGRGAGPNAITNITYGGYPNGGDFTEYNDLIHHGSMSLGFSITNLGSGSPLDLDSMYDPVNKTLTIQGPHNFDNSGRGDGNPLYHGAPWIEFNVDQGAPSNTPPVASFNFTPVFGEVGTIFEFDASESYDGQDPANLLQVRWDWESDGTWDTPWSTMKNATHSFGAPGNYATRLEVIDSGGLTDETTRMVRVITPPIEPGATINVSYATSVTIWEQTGEIYSYDFDINSLMDGGGGFYTSAQISELYILTSDGIHLTIDCYRDPPTYLPVWGAGGNVVAARLNGVPGYPDGLYASVVVSSVIDSKGVAASVDNALGPETQLGPYNNMYATLLGDNHTQIVLGFTVPGAPPPPPPPPPINATVNFDMDSFNPVSNGKWVTVYIGLPDGYSVEDVNISSIMLNSQVPAAGPYEIRDFDHDKVLELMVKFDRTAAIHVMNIGKAIRATITGSLTNGTKFQGSDMITVLAKMKHDFNLQGPLTGSPNAAGSLELAGLACLPLTVVGLGITRSAAKRSRR